MAAGREFQAAGPQSLSWVCLAKVDDVFGTCYFLLLSTQLLLLFQLRLEIT